MVGNIWSLFQVMESLLSFQSIIVNYGIPHHLVRLIQRLLSSVEEQIITLTPNDPWYTISQEEPNPIGRFWRFVQWFVQWFNDFRGIASMEKTFEDQDYHFCKELSHDVSRIGPHLLS